MSGRSIRAAVANPRTASTTLSSYLPLVTARLRGIIRCLPGPVVLRTMSSRSIARHNPFTPRQMRMRGARAAASVSSDGGESRSPAVSRRSPQAAPGVRLLAAQIGRLDGLRVAPDGVLLAEVEVVARDFLEGLVL